MSTQQPTQHPLPIRHHMALTLAATHYRWEGARATDARRLLGYTETRFWQVVGALLDDPTAEAAMPTEVRRLRRLRDARRRQRTASRAAE